MTLPKPWLEDNDASSAVRDLLHAGKNMDPPDGAERAVWLALLGQVGAAGAGGAAGGGAAGGTAKAGAAAKAASAAGTTAGGVAAKAVGGGVVKAMLLGAVSGIIAVSGYTVLEPSPSKAPEIQAPVANEAPASPPKVSEAKGTPAAPTEQPKAEPPPRQVVSAPAPTSTGGTAEEPAPKESAPASAAPAPDTPEDRASRLREENDLLNQARGALRGGDPGRAMAILEQARQKFPGGVLGQEREALTIEALAKSGAREAASARAAAFIAAHPTSPHAARLQAFVQP